MTASTVRRVLIPGGSGAVGEGAVRAYLATGAQVVVPTRTDERADEFRRVLGDDATDHLHLFTHDYTTFEGAEALATTMQERLGGIDDVVAPIGGWWAGKQLWEIGRDDWDAAFTGLATTHMAVARAVLPRLGADGSYAVVVGESALFPVPGSGLVSMEQAAILMMREVLAAEAGDSRRIHALVLGPVRTRAVPGETLWVSADQIGAVAVALSNRPAATSQEVLLRTGAEAEKFLAELP
ncbi:SDR family oxidoreductase [Actinoplanes sp. N902-109]|uniref:SDR family NAD(P)-dependent oxidoreductase n=1 Tax=Actinoplanes sp. (strain N902-109) TaxID=649831 RepID=UPI000329660F|nr:SDR family oxidoreductase [Actinoplanes sp. N902-109]AGL16240.1 oxidoreductase [Actinoplanes sp. N902-109]